MCKIGDIIVIDNYIGDDGKFINRHSFVIISNKKGKIQGISYDLAANVISSIKNEKQKYKKLKYKENLELKNEDVISKFKSEKDSYIIVDKNFYFKRKESITTY